MKEWMEETRVKIDRLDKSQLLWAQREKTEYSEKTQKACRDPKGLCLLAKQWLPTIPCACSQLPQVKRICISNNSIIMLVEQAGLVHMPPD